MNATVYSASARYWAWDFETWGTWGGVRPDYYNIVGEGDSLTPRDVKSDYFCYLSTREYQSSGQLIGTVYWLELEREREQNLCKVIDYWFTESILWVGNSPPPRKAEPLQYGLGLSQIWEHFYMTRTYILPFIRTKANRPCFWTMGWPRHDICEPGQSVKNGQLFNA